LSFIEWIRATAEYRRPGREADAPSVFDDL
jgi:hypothetical protein